MKQCKVSWEVGHSKKSSEFKIPRCSGCGELHAADSGDQPMLCIKAVATRSLGLQCSKTHENYLRNGPYAPFGFESIEKQLWRNKQNDRPISDSEIKAVLSQLFKTDQWLPPAGHVSEDVTSHA
ncbi:hypothetical protein AVEN_63697-1 [Araneus ventricosus]|uniref:Uncharacterized protein n=1 Tax=Araneus ventricosus TaxID=182803 RepID=A0A4Y2JHZ2_ARAVE|nr:hypothetical protein AVEN_63697-1 [Araneus ventricosus]